MKKSFVIIFIVCALIVFTSQLVKAQNFFRIDSLNTLFNTSHVDTNKINILIQIASEYKNSDYKKALEYIAQAVEISEQLEDPEAIVTSISKIGYFYYLQSDYLNALDIYKISFKACQKLENNKYVAVMYGNIGKTYKILGNYYKSIEFYQKSLDIDLALNNRHRIAFGYGSVGNIYKKIAHYEKALENYQKALEINEELKNSNGIAYTCNGLGSIFTELGNYEKAITYFQKALDINKKVENKKGMIYSIASIGNLYQKLNNLEKAIEYNENALKISYTIEDTSFVAHALSNLGYIYKEQKKYNKALDYFQKALSINEQINYQKSVSSLLAEIAYLYAEFGNTQLALKYCRKALAIALKLEALNEIKNAYKNLSFIYTKTNDYQKAYNYYVLYSNLNDSIFSIKSAEKIAEMQTKFETEKKEKEIELLTKDKALYQADIKKQKNLMLSFIFGFIIILIFSVLLLRQFSLKKKANLVLAKQNVKINQQKKEITDSIIYAKRIQTAVLPPDNIIARNLYQYFILFKPRDIVSGDFYWIKKIDNLLIITVADCTGHGVPGAFMCMLSIALLNDIVRYNEITTASQVLNELRNQVKAALRQSGKEGEAEDGIDMALCVIDFENMKMQFAGAMNPLYIVRNKEFTEIKGDKMPIGIYHTEKENFTNHAIDLHKNDCYYMFSDGFIDQFGGEADKRFTSKKFKKLLMEIHEKPMHEQQKILNKSFENWKQANEQVDDITVAGFRI